VSAVMAWTGFGNVGVDVFLFVVSGWLVSLCLHEYGHAWAAYRLGDPTAKMLGRLTLDPRAHVDPIGTLLFPMLRLLYPGLFLLGWAKPVPVTAENFRHPKRDNALVAAAGPAMNLVLAFLALVVLGVTAAAGFFGLSAQTGGTLFEFLHFFFWLNFGLALFNLFPLYPLDGNWILKALLPDRLSYAYSRLDRFGIWAFLAVVVFFPSVFSQLFLPAVAGLYWMLHLAGLDGLAQMLNLG
ncbi:MAG TPA: site-2 protease family protein, partial [bacterium]|nr:site-2 protease family protein [bacterium]